MLKCLHIKPLNIFVGSFCIVFLVDVLQIAYPVSNTASSPRVINMSNSDIIKNIYHLHQGRQDAIESFNLNVKYIFLWTPDSTPLLDLANGDISFSKNNCSNTNCFITSDRKYVNNISCFDALVFGSYGPGDLTYLPPMRNSKQKYIFASQESGSYYPIMHPAADNFFNWTWTYKLSSDISWRYINIFDLNGTLVGPTRDMKWPHQFEPVKEKLSVSLKRKTKAAAWIASHCSTIGRREQFVEKLDGELKKLGWSVDIYGGCSNKVCNKSIECYKMLAREYYFYLAFENCFDEDYVTEKLLIALENSMVPVVYGGAEYSRFVPPGSYLNARELGPEKLAKKMDEIMKNFSSYVNFFRWRNHYKYEYSVNEGVCNLCAALNSAKFGKRSIYPSFRLWWYGGIKNKLQDFLLTLFLMDRNLQVLAAGYNNTDASNLALLQMLKKHKSLYSQFSLGDSRHYLNLLKSSQS